MILWHDGWIVEVEPFGESVNLILEHSIRGGYSGVTLTPDKAREVAALLLKAADETNEGESASG